MTLDVIVERVRGDRRDPGDKPPTAEGSRDTERQHDPLELIDADDDRLVATTGQPEPFVELGAAVGRRR